MATEAHGDVIVVRIADDIVVGFQEKADAEQFWKELAERMRKFNLELHPEKTRLLEFGRDASIDRRQRGDGKPEVFDFLGFTHVCGKSKAGHFLIHRQTIRKRLQAKLKEVKLELKRRMHDPVPEVGQWLRAVVRGHFQYYGVPTNKPALSVFWLQVGRFWRQALSQRSQNRQTPLEAHVEAHSPLVTPAPHLPPLSHRPIARHDYEGQNLR